MFRYHNSDYYWGEYEFSLGFYNSSEKTLKILKAFHALFSSKVCLDEFVPICLDTVIPSETLSLRLRDGFGVKFYSNPNGEVILSFIGNNACDFSDVVIVK